MTSKTISLQSKRFDIQGVAVDDPYFMSLSDEVDSEFNRIVNAFLDPDAVVLDVGANIGVTSLILSAHLKTGRVYFFEPSPTVFPVLSRNLSTNNVANVEARNVAIGAERGELSFAGESAYGHLVIEEQDASGAGTVTVEVHPLDEIADDLKLERLDFVKIDVEGFEPDVLAGAKRIEERFSPLYYLEFNGWCLSTFREMNPFDFAKQLVRQFSFVFDVQRNGEVIRVGPEDAQALLHRNLVKNGCVSNILATNSEERIPGSALAAMRKQFADAEAMRKQFADAEAMRKQFADASVKAELANAHAMLDHARKYPWKYVRGALMSRLSRS